MVASSALFMQNPAKRRRPSIVFSGSVHHRRDVHGLRGSARPQLNLEARPVGRRVQEAEDLPHQRAVRTGDVQPHRCADDEDRLDVEQPARELIGLEYHPSSIGHEVRLRRAFEQVAIPTPVLFQRAVHGRQLFRLGVELFLDDPQLLVSHVELLQRPATSNVALAALWHWPVFAGSLRARGKRSGSRLTSIREGDSWRLSLLADRTTRLSIAAGRNRHATHGEHARLHACLHYVTERHASRLDGQVRSTGFRREFVRRPRDRRAHEKVTRRTCQHEGLRTTFAEASDTVVSAYCARDEQRCRY